MIVVSIGRGRHKMMIAEHKHLAEEGADIVELRVDYIVRAVNLKRLLAERPCPTIVTCRREQDGGKWEKTEEERIMLLRSAIADGVDYVDLEEDIAGQIPRFGKTKRIVSYHNFHETPKNLREIHEKMQELDPDIIKMATMAHNPRDNIRMLELIAESEIPTVAFCMGDMGTPSRILGARFGAPFTYATLHQDRALAPGQLSFKQMREVYHYNEITPNTDVYAVIADPIGHSMSPSVHNAAFKALDMEKVYVPIRVPTEELEEFMSYCRGFGLKGPERHDPAQGSDFRVHRQYGPRGRSYRRRQHRGNGYVREDGVQHRLQGGSGVNRQHARPRRRRRCANWAGRRSS